MFENFKTFETTYAGRPVVVETGKTCGLANGSCWVRYGETVVMANVTASAKPREGVDSHFPSLISLGMVLLLLSMLVMLTVNSFLTQLLSRELRTDLTLQLQALLKRSL